MKISQERLNELKKMSEKEIDFSDIPPLTEEQLKKSRFFKDVHPELFQSTSHCTADRER